MTNPPITEQKCIETLRLLDQYMDDQLNAGLKSVVRQHLDQCSSCSGELELRRQLRKRLKAAATATGEVSPYLETRVLANVRETERHRGWFGWRRQLTVAAAMVTVCVGTFIAHELGYVSFPSQQEDYIASIAQSVVPIMRIGLGDHLHCAAFRKYTQNPPSPEKIASDLGSDYKGIAEIVRPLLPAGFEIVLAHKCRYHGRQFVHITMKSESKLATLVLARRQKGETFDNSNLRPIVASGSLPVYQAMAQPFAISGFQSRDHLVYLISDLSNQTNTDLMLAMAPALREMLAKMEA